MISSMPPLIIIYVLLILSIIEVASGKRELTIIRDVYQLLPFSTAPLMGPDNNYHDMNFW
jgi:hypothetical protein